MAIGEYQDFEQMARYAGSLPDGTDVEYSPRPYIVAPPLGDVVAAQGRELAAHEARIEDLYQSLDLTAAELRDRLAALEKYSDYMDAQYSTLSGYIATMGQELLDSINLEATKGSNFATFMGERHGDHENRIAHLERLLHKAINCPHCVDDYGNEVAP